MTGAEGHRSRYQVTFDPGNQRVWSLPDETLLDCARRNGVRIASVCGGRGLCKSCVVRIADGPVPSPSVQDSEFFSPEEIADHWRRACQAFPAGDCRIEISARARATPMRSEIESEDVWVPPDPAVRLCAVTVEEPTLERAISDDQRLVNALNTHWPGAGYRVDIGVSRSMANSLRADGGRISAAVRFGEIVGLVPQGNGALPGLAVDVGTTNMGVMLVNLRSARTIAGRVVENPQAVHGSDVITRIGFARSSPLALKALQQMAVKAINQAAQELCGANSLVPEQIADVVIAGNTVMHHLLLGIPVDLLGAVPFVPTVSSAMDVKARDVGIKAMPGAYVHAMPNIAAFVGGDHTAMLLAIDDGRDDRTIVALDIGTNTEISLLRKGELSTISCPSGPTLEGGHITSGMRSAPGAIESIDLSSGELRIKTIADAPPVGICGSGVLDAVAQLYLAGILTPTGKMLTGHPRVRIRKHQPEFVLADKKETGGRSVVFSQDDVRAVQLAKGAIRAGIKILLEEAGLAETDLDQIIVAGAFGNYMNLASAIAIDMLPSLPTDRFAQVGNAAGIGAKLALVSYPHRARAQAMAASSRYLELAGTKRFNSAFMNSMRFPAKAKN